MKIRYFVVASFLIIVALAIAQAVTKSEFRKLPEINWDSSPLDRSNKHRVSSYADILDQVTPAVVSVSTSKILEGQRYSLPPQFKDDPFLRRFFGVPEQQEDQPRAEGLGSGVIVSQDGYILTNNHVIENVDEVSVRLKDGRQFDAEIIGTDSKTDVAVLKIEGNDLPALTLADSDQARVGDVVFAVGNPLRVGLTVTQGIVSATNRTELSLIEEGGYENFLQTDASINPGNSGGPLVDAQGRILGINTAILSQSGGSIGIGFAVPTNLAKNIMTSLIETGEVRRGYLGVSIGALDSELAEQFEMDDTNGAVVSKVFPNTPAEAAGLEVYDVITAINGRTVSSSSDLRLKISQVNPGSEVVMTVIRDGDFKQLPVVIGNLNDAGKLSAADFGSEEPVELLEGVSLAEMTEALRQQFRVGQSIRGLIVTEVSGDSPFDDNLMPGMVIMGINRKKVETLSEAYDLLTPGKNLLYVYYEGRNNFLVIRKD